MKDRIAHIIRAKNMTAAEFAIRLGIQPSNVSHLLAGRNNPSLEFVKKLKETFPEYNLDWIVMGKGPMTVSEPFVGLSAVDHTAESKESVVMTEEDAPVDSLVAPEPIRQSKTDRTEPLRLSHIDLSQLILVYADHTFEVLTPR